MGRNSLLDKLNKPDKTNDSTIIVWIATGFSNWWNICSNALCTTAIKLGAGGRTNK